MNQQSAIGNERDTHRPVPARHHPLHTVQCIAKTVALEAPRSRRLKHQRRLCTIEQGEDGWSPRTVMRQLAHINTERRDPWPTAGFE